MIKGLNRYILCSLINSPCSFQRYCVSRQDVINTEGAKTCVARSKKETVINDEIIKEELSVFEPFVIEEVQMEESKENKKDFGTVFLVSKSGVYYNYNGQSRYVAGKFDVKIGDKIPV